MNVSADLFLTPYYINRAANGTVTGIEDYTYKLKGYGYRTIFDIFHTCFLTIVLCTWAAIHSNIPSRNHAALRFWYRANLLLVTLITPDLIILWAAKQFYAARALQVLYHDGIYIWTQAHGFFALMGGFRDISGRALSPYSDDFKALFLSGEIDITEDEIQDRSKMDLVLRVLNILQLSWFIINYLCRFWSSNLYATEVEILTFTFALLSFAIYLLWWNKPRNVNLPLRVRLPNTSSRVDPEPPLSTWTLLEETLYFNLALSMLSYKENQEDSRFISRSDLATYYGKLTWKDMASAVEWGAVSGCVSGTMNIIAGVFGYRPLGVKGLLWVASAAVGCVFPLYLQLAILYSRYSLKKQQPMEEKQREEIEEKERFQRLTRALNGKLCIALLLVSVIGRLTLIIALGNYMLTPYGYKAFITAPIARQLHIF